MPRDLHPDTAAALSQDGIYWAVLCMFTFRSGVRWLWSGPETLTLNGQEYTGVGSMGQLGAIDEGSSGEAEGTSVTLSGVDPVYLAEALTDVVQGAPAKIWFALLTPGMTVIGTPYLWFSGIVDSPPAAIAAEAMSIVLQLETQLANHERASSLKYTSADQRLLHPDDTGFDHVEQENDIALVWGS